YVGSDDVYVAEDDVPKPARSEGKKRQSAEKPAGKKTKRVKYEDDPSSDSSSDSSSGSSSGSSSDSSSPPSHAPAPAKKRRKTGELMVRSLPPPPLPPCASSPPGPGGLSCCDACFAAFADSVLAAAARNVGSRVVRDKARAVAELRERLGGELVALRELNERHGGGD
ncbi:hypothetical protein TeGR_g2236, partial [Tetraparma gracilis]